MDNDPLSHQPSPIEVGHGQASGKEDGGRDELAPGSPSLSPASSDHRPQTSEPVKRKRGRPAKSKTASTPPAKRAAVQAESTNAEASGSQLAPEPSSERPTRSRPVRARKTTIYTEQSSGEEDELDPHPPATTTRSLPNEDDDDADARSPSTGPEDMLPYGADGSYTPLKSPKPHNPNPTGRKRGRPPGSKNKNPRPPKALEEGKLPRVKRPPKLDADGNPVPKKARKPGSGRPKGSKNKATLLKEAEQRRKEEEDNGGPLPPNDDIEDDPSLAYNLHDAPPPVPDVDVDLALKPDAAALHLAHAALLQGLPPNALDLDHHQQQHPYDDGQMGGDVQGYPDELQYGQAEAIQVALQQQMLLRREQEEEERVQAGGI